MFKSSKIILNVKYIFSLCVYYIVNINKDYFCLQISNAIIEIRLISVINNIDFNKQKKIMSSYRTYVLFYFLLNIFKPRRIANE